MERKITSIYLCVVMIATVFGVAVSMNVSVGETNDPSTVPEWHELPNPSGIFLNILDGITGPNVAVVWSDTKAWGFSSHTGEWHGPILITGVTEDTAWASENVVVLRSDTEDWYAFSALTGTWDITGIIADPIQVALAMSKNVALIFEKYGENASAFSAITASWESQSTTPILWPEHCWVAENIAVIWGGEIYVFNALTGEWHPSPEGGTVAHRPGANLAVVKERIGSCGWAFSTLTNQWHIGLIPEHTCVKGMYTASNTALMVVGDGEYYFHVAVFSNIDFEWHWQGITQYETFNFALAENVALVKDITGINQLWAFSGFTHSWTPVQGGFLDCHFEASKNVGLFADGNVNKIYGFSAFTGYWYPLSFGGNVWSCKSSANVAMVITDLSNDKYELYGFSATTGSWDIRTINEPLYGYEASDNIALAFNSTKAYAFSANTGHWYEQIGDPHQFDDHYKIAPNVCLVWKLKSEHTDTGYLAYGFSAVTSEWKEEAIYDDEENPWQRHLASGNVALVWHNCCQSKAHGFSAITGSWNITDVDGQIDRTGTGGNIAAITTTASYSYAFNANDREWYPQYVEGPPGPPLLGLSVDDNVAVVWSSTHAYAFG